MRKILSRFLAAGLSLALMFQAVAPGAWAQEKVIDSSPSDILQTEGPGEESSNLEAEWEETGALQTDGTPVTADQGDTPEAGGVTDSPLDTDQPAEPATYILTLNLDGGQVNTLQNAGWSQSSYEIYQWTRPVSE